MGGIFNNKNRGARKGESKGAGVQSRRKDPAIPEVQPLDSVNAPKVTSDQAGLAKAQQVMADAAQQHYQDQLYKNQQTQAEYNEKYGTANPSQNPNSNYLKFEGTAFNEAAATPQPVAEAKPAETTPTEQKEPDPTKVVVKTKKTADFTPYQFTATPYDEDAATKKMEKSSWLTKMNNDARDLDKEYKKKADKSSKYAKATAWGNFFSALGQLAGGGKNTYIAPDQTYLKSALSKADEARKMYDAIKASNKKSLDAAKQSWLEADRKLHAESQEQMREFYKSLNEQGYRNASNNAVETTVEYDDLAKEGAENDKKRANAAQTQADAAMIRAQAYAENPGGESKDKSEWFTPEYGGKIYMGDQKTAGKFADIMSRLLGFYDPDIAAGKLQVDQALHNSTDFDRLTRRFLTKFGNHPDVKEFIEKLEEKTTSKKK